MVFGRKKDKVVLKESEKEKRARKLAASAKDPSKALAAAEPFEQAQTAPIGISLLKHKDMYGNEIVDPDKSNPTRHRLERPLDTIRGFERAIVKEEEDKRLSRYGTETGSERGGNYTAASSRRQSMVRPYGDSYNSYNGRVPRNESFDNARQYRDSNQRPPYGNRVQMMNGDQGYYNDVDAHSPSVETNGTGSGSYNSRGWNSNDTYSTNPSSESSSYRGRDYNEQNGGPPVPKKTPSPLSKSQAAYPNGSSSSYGQVPNGGMIVNRKPVPSTSSLSRSSSNNHVPAGYANYNASAAAAAQGQGQGYSSSQGYGQSQGDVRGPQDQGGYYDEYNNSNNNSNNYNNNDQQSYYYGNEGSQDYYDAASPVSPIDVQQGNGFGGRTQQPQQQQQHNPQNNAYYLYQQQQQQQQQKQQQYRQQQPQYNYNPAAVVQGYSNSNSHQHQQQQHQQRRPNTLSKQHSSASASQKPARTSWLKRTLSRK